MPKQKTEKIKFYHTGGFMAKSLYITPQDILNYIVKQQKQQQ